MPSTESALAGVPPTDTPATLQRFLRFPEVKRIIPLSTGSIYDKIANGEFPRPVRLSENQ